MAFSFLWENWELLKEWEERSEQVSADFSGFQLINFDEKAEKKEEKKQTIYSKDVISALEQYPHIIKNILVFWWSPNDFNEYLKSLLTVWSDRLTRQWFPKEVISDLNMLHHIHDEIFWLPIKKSNNPFYDDPWASLNKIK